VFIPLSQFTAEYLAVLEGLSQPLDETRPMLEHRNDPGDDGLGVIYDISLIEFFDLKPKA